jgi:hypothetical protein
MMDIETPPETRPETPATISFETSPPSAKIYRERSIWVGAYVGGPLAAGYMLAENFRVFNEPAKARMSWVFAVITTIVVFGGLLLLPDDINIPNTLIPTLYLVVALTLVQLYQKKDIDRHVASGGACHSWKRAVGVHLLIGVLTALPVFGLVYLTQDDADTRRCYGVSQNEISYNRGNMTAAEVDYMSSALTSVEFFDDASKKHVYVRHVNGTPGTYEISISFDTSVVSIPEATEFLTLLRKEIQSLFPDDTIVINIVPEEGGSVVKRIE